MTDQTTAALIAEAKREGSPEAWPIGVRYKPLLFQLATALEAAEQEKAEAWRIAGEQTRMERDRAEAAEQRAEYWENEYETAEDMKAELREKSAGLAAVVEKVRERAERIRRDYAALPRHEADDVDRGMSLAAGVILRDVEASAPADLLREVKAEVWDDAYETGTGDGRYTDITINPYRDKEQP